MDRDLPDPLCLRLFFARDGAFKPDRRNADPDRIGDRGNPVDGFSLFFMEVGTQELSICW